MVEHVRFDLLSAHWWIAAEDDDPDNMEEIDLSNIINSGRRTRGKTIDFAKAAEAAGDDLDDDEDDDDDFEAPLDDDAMQDWILTCITR